MTQAIHKSRWNSACGYKRRAPLPSVFISYSHDPTNPAHEEKVAALAASLIRDSITVFFDQNRGAEEEEVPWPIWMEDKIEAADHVLMVCTELYWSKVRQGVGGGSGMGVCWEANLIYNKLYLARLNTAKFVPILFSSNDVGFIPAPLTGANRFVLDSDDAYTWLYAFLTGQQRRRFPEQGGGVVSVAQRDVEPLFSLKTGFNPQPVSSAVTPIPAPRKSPGQARPQPVAFAASPVYNDSRIEHFVVLMLSGRSFDHMLGFSGIPGIDGLTCGGNQSRHQRRAGCGFERCEIHRRL